VMNTNHDLQAHIEHLLSCNVIEKIGEHIVDETFEGSPVWQGIVHEFRINGHSDTDTCYAWSSSIEGSERRKFYAVLKVPPVNSPQDAVRAAIVVDYKIV